MRKRAPIRCVVVEDEPPAAKMLGRLINENPDLELAGAAASGQKAVALIDKTKPDLLFLDIQMPDFSGLEVLRRIDRRPLHVVFTTAHDDYAVTAFELGAIDYLLKPFGQPEFSRAVERARGASARHTRSDLLARLHDGDKRLLERLYVRAGAKIIPLSVHDIDRFQADAGFAALHVGGKAYHLDVALGVIEARLDPARFARVHRAHIVNLEKVSQIERLPDRRLRLVLVNGEMIIASRAYSKSLRRRFRDLP